MSATLVVLIFPPPPALIVGVIVVHVFPPSVDLCKPAPLPIVPTYTLPELSQITFETFQKPVVESSRFHVTPWSGLFQTPPPSTASTLNVFSPVPQYIIFVLVGSWHILEMARLA